jgi:hypothetical protein
VANDQICIVDPSSYEIVEVISGSRRTAGTDTRASTARLMLTEKEKEIILSEVGTNGGSTMGLGALREGAKVPRGVQVRAFPGHVAQQVPRVENYRYFTAENSVAIVDPQGSRVELLIESVAISGKSAFIAPSHVLPRPRSEMSISRVTHCWLRPITAGPRHGFCRNRVVQSKFRDTAILPQSVALIDEAYPSRAYAEYQDL